MAGTKEHVYGWYKGACIWLVLDMHIMSWYFRSMYMAGTKDRVNQSINGTGPFVSLYMAGTYRSMYNILNTIRHVYGLVPKINRVYVSWYWTHV